MIYKTTTAALLAVLAAAGLAAADAHAQTNTERLKAIDAATQDILEDTEGTPGALAALADAAGAIQAGLSGLAASLSNVMDAVAGIQDAVDGMSAKVSGMDTSIRNTESSVNRVETAVGGVSAEVGVISSKIMGMDALMQNVAGLDARLANMEGAMTELEGAIAELDNTIQSMDGGSSVLLSVLASSSIENSAQLAEVLLRLASLEDGLRHQDTEAKKEVTKTTRPGNILFEGEAERNVDSYDYKRYGDANTDTTGKYYELDMTFSCSADVFLDRAYLVHDGDGNADDIQFDQHVRYFGLTRDQDGIVDASRHRTHNFVTVDGRDLFDTHFRFSGSTDTRAGQTYDLPALFNNKPLKAGETLRFESQVYDRNTTVMYDRNGAKATTAEIKMIGGATRTYSLPFFEVNVEWLTYNSGATCSIGFGTSGVSTGLTKTSTLMYGVTANPDHKNRSLKDFGNTIDCGGEPVEITAITVDTADDWRLAGFVSVVLEHGPNEHRLEFDRNAKEAVITNDDFLPIYLGNDGLTISGTIPLENLLISLTYNSQPDTACRAPSIYS